MQTETRKKPLPYVLATLILIMRGSAQFYPQFLMHQNHFYSTRPVHYKPIWAYYSPNIKFSNAQVMRRASFGQLQPLFPFLLGYPFFRTFFQKWPPHFREFDPNFVKENQRKVKNATPHPVIWGGPNGQIAVRSAALEAALGSLYVRKKGTVRFFLAKK